MRLTAPALLLGVASVAPLLPTPAQQVEWRHYGADRAHSRFLPLDQVNKSNLKRLQEDWRWESVDAPIAEKNRRLGEQLLGPNGGFSCSKCHSVGARKAQMEVGFGVIDLVQAKRRLRDAFYLRWMMNPTRVHPGTRMPAYTDEAGNSPLVKILDGDGVRQFEAIWQSIDARQAATGSTR